MMRLILASRSPIRAKILSDAGVVFDTQSADVDEGAIKNSFTGDGAALATHLAVVKAQAINAPPNALVLGCDQTLVCDGVAFDKAETLELSKKKLQSLRGRTHQLHSGYAFVKSNEILVAGAASATLHMRDFSDAFLDWYLQHAGSALTQCVGAYEYEGLGAQLFDHVDGDTFTILGMPRDDVLRVLRDHGAVMV